MPRQFTKTEVTTEVIKKQRRLVQATLIALAAVLISIVQSLLFGKWIMACILLLQTGILVFAIGLTRRARVDEASQMIFASLIVSLSAISFFYEGIHDPVVSAFPGLMIFAAMFCTRRFFIGMLLSIIAAISLIVLSNAQGWHVNIVAESQINALIDYVLILSVTAFCVWAVASDLRSALIRLENENDRIRDALSRIDSLAHHDVLTGLPNRLMARVRFDQTMELNRRTGLPIAVLFLDLDNFKTVNDSLGHAAGDLLLKEVAKRLQLVARSSDTVSRQGGDEFLMIVSGQTVQEDVATIALKIINLLSTPIKINGMELLVTCSIGVAIYPRDGINFDMLLKHSDMAMYKAKESGRNAFRFYDHEMNSSVIEHLQLIAGIRSALLKNEFKLFYQPQYELKTGRIIGVEALIRWMHPEQGLILPGKFIQAAERSGQIHEIGAWVIEEACRQAKKWQNMGLKDLVVAVNLSPVQFRRDNVEREIINALESSQLAPDCFELELTESLLIVESEQIGPLLSRFRAMGIRLTIDDFGTGYSNLGYLSRFDVERLKIDRSFVQRMTENSGDESLVRAIIEMAHSLNLEVVAEGIENAQTLAQLVELGCEYGQGFHWSPALPPEALFEFVTNHQKMGRVLVGSSVE